MDFRFFHKRSVELVSRQPNPRICARARQKDLLCTQMYKQRVFERLRPPRAGWQRSARPAGDEARDDYNRVCEHKLEEKAQRQVY